MQAYIHSRKIPNKLYLYRFYLLLITLLMNFFFPSLHEGSLQHIFLKLTEVAILLLSAANFIDKDQRGLRITWFIFGFINFAAAFAFNFFPEKTEFELIQSALMFVFFLVITISLLQQIFAIRKVTGDVIVGSFCGYLLIGVLSFNLMSMVDLLIPNSFSGLSDYHFQRANELFYFAYTCLTTLGFGDIVPTGFFSQKISVFTAAIGQFYISIVVAILVGRYMRNTSVHKNLK